MPVAPLDIVYGFLIPALVAWALVVLSQKGLPAAAAHGMAGVAFVAGTAVGYWLLQLGPLAPRSHWHWLPYALLLILPAGFFLAVRSRWGRGAWVLWALAAVAAAWWLVPDRNALQPSRPVLIALVLGLMSLDTWAIGWAVGRERDGPSIVALAGLLVATAALLFLSGSLRFAQIAGCGLGALVGVELAGAMRPSVPLGSLAAPVALFLVASLMIAQVNSFSDVPAICYLLLALAPAALPLRRFVADRSSGPLARRAAAAIPLVLAVIAIAVAAWSERS